MKGPRRVRASNALPDHKCTVANSVAVVEVGGNEDSLSSAKI